jgi:hypothetical protein
MAQEALERAESRALDRSVLATNIDKPITTPLVRQIRDARDALAAGDRSRTMHLIEMALADAPGAPVVN